MNICKATRVCKFPSSSTLPHKKHDRRQTQLSRLSYFLILSSHLDSPSLKEITPKKLKLYHSSFCLTRNTLLEMDTQGSRSLAGLSLSVTHLCFRWWFCYLNAYDQDHNLQPFQILKELNSSTDWRPEQMISLAGMWCKDVTNSNPVRPFFDSHSTFIYIPLHQLWVWSSVALIGWPYRLGIWSGWRSPTGSPSGVKYLSSSLASSNVSDSRWLSLCPSNCSGECANRGTLEKRQWAKTNLRQFVFLFFFFLNKLMAFKKTLNHRYSGAIKLVPK